MVVEAGREQRGHGGPLGALRVLDLSDEKGGLGARLFADLGAEVVKVEPPGGCPTRRIPPFVDDVPGADRSLYFLAYSAGKKSVTLDLDQRDGQEIFRRLADTADFLIDSQPLGRLDALGIGYDALAARNPALIHAAITPFGDAGSAAHWKATDIVSWASGGLMYLTGEPGRPPLSLEAWQSGLHAGAEAAAACMLAHLERVRSGLGQKVVIDTQACLVWTTMNASAFPLLHGDQLHRSGITSGSADVARKILYPCADGHVQFLLSGGSYLSTAGELVGWMVEEGVAPDWLREVDFDTWTSAQFATASPEFIALTRRCEAAIEAFLAAKPRREIYQFALDRNVVIAPMATVEDITADEQLAARDFFQPVHHPVLGRDLTMVGPFAKFSATPIAALPPAPTLGQHNREILGDELGVGADELQALYSLGVI